MKRIGTIRPRLSASNTAPPSVIERLKKARAMLADWRAGCPPGGLEADSDGARLMLKVFPGTVDALGRIANADCMQEAWVTLERYKISGGFAMIAAVEAAGMQTGIFDWWKKSPSRRSKELQIMLFMACYLASSLRHLPREFEEAGLGPRMAHKDMLNLLADDLESFDHLQVPFAEKQSTAPHKMLAIRLTCVLKELTGKPLPNVAAKSVEAFSGIKVDARRIREWRAMDNQNPAEN
jgi:hypothetical protein